MGFTKKKLETPKDSGKSSFTNIRDIYFASKRRNQIVAVLFSIIASICIGFLGFIVLSKLSGINIGWQVPTFVTHAFPFLQMGPQEPEKFNILLTGVGGAGHDGSDLTDTIILASVNRRTNTVTMLSIPRDLYIEYPTKWRGRINELYQRALKNFSPEVSMQKLAEKVTEMTGEKVDAYFKIDFAWFSRFVDVLGGVEVDVPDDIVDTSYPDSNWGYQTFRIKKGLQTLDGSTALKYVRSRHTTSDFDRSLRQQLVLKSIKNKLLSLDALTSPSKLQALYGAVTDHVQTDLSIKQLASLALFAKDLPDGHILSYNINDSCFQSVSYCDAGGFLYTPERSLFNGAAVLLPDGGTVSNISQYREISQFANLLFNYPQAFIDQEEIVILNASKVSGIANRLALKLKRFGFNIPDKGSVKNAKQAYPQSQIEHVWDPTAGTGVSASSDVLTALTQFVQVTPVPVGQLQDNELVGPRIGIILGSDANLILK